MKSEISKPKVLVVDDDFINKEILAHGLQNDYEVFTASSGKEALEEAEKLQPDTILLDIIMPEKKNIRSLVITQKMTGFDLEILIEIETTQH